MIENSDPGSELHFPNKPAFISIIISAFNEGGLLLKTIDSIYNTTQTAFEIIVVDDASGDDTSEECFKSYPRVRYHRNLKRLGLICSRIVGRLQANGKYLVFMDAHCKPEPGWEIHLLNASQQHNDRIIAVPAIPILDISNWENSPAARGNAMIFNRSLDMKWVAEINDDMPYSESAIFAGCTCLIAKSFYDELQGFDEGLLLWGGENIDLSLRCWMLGGKVLVVKSAIVGHMFRSSFNYAVSKENIIANKLRVAAVHFTPERFNRVVRSFSLVKDLPPGLFPTPESYKDRREYLLKHRLFDDGWFMQKFNIDL